jgi:excisionase family DNA binding protein
MDCELKHTKAEPRDIDDFFKLIQDIQYDRRLKIDEVAEIFGVGLTKAREMVKDGKIPKPVVKDGNYVRWSYKEILQAEKMGRD